MSEVASKHRILVVNDGSSGTQLLTAHLISAGYDVASVVDATEALHDLSRDGADLVVVSDSGACRSVKSSSTAGPTPVLMITTATAIDDRVQGEDAGADDFLACPFGRSELLVRVNALLRIKSLAVRLDEKISEVARLEAALARQGAGFAVTPSRL